VRKYINNAIEANEKEKAHTVIKTRYDNITRTCENPSELVPTLMENSEFTEFEFEFFSISKDVSISCNINTYPP
jgi:hypothetical protein